LGSDARRGLEDHPTVKPTAMLEDALFDLTNRGDIVLDPFLGSGSTLIAAETTSRVCRGVELDPLYIDVIVRRFEAATGQEAVLFNTGDSFANLAARRTSADLKEEVIAPTVSKLFPANRADNDVTPPRD
jgi:adenine specific DNA methylase Mod